MTNVIKASHSKKFSSLVGPAIIPSGGFNVNSKIINYVSEFNLNNIKTVRLYSAINRRNADPAIGTNLQLTINYLWKITHWKTRMI